MGKFFLMAISWAAFAVIFAGEVLRVDGLGGAFAAATGYVYVINGFGVLWLLASLSKTCRATYRVEQAKRGFLARTHGLVRVLAWVCLLGYADWQWSLWIMLAVAFVSVGIVSAEEAA